MSDFLSVAKQRRSLTSGREVPLTDTTPSQHLRLPRLGLGTAPLGGLYGLVPDAQAVETIRYALDHGVTFIDSAPSYGPSEERIGMALDGTARPRDSFTIATKTGRIHGPDHHIVYDFSRDAVRHTLDESLRRLRVDTIDIVHLHDLQSRYREAIDSGFRALAELREQGLIRAIGAGTGDLKTLADCMRDAQFDCFLVAAFYHLLDQSALDVLNLCHARGITVIAGGVLATGILATGAVPGAKYGYGNAPAHILERVRRIEAICASHNVPLSAVAMQFPLAHPAVKSVVLGARSKDEVAANLQAFHTDIPPALWSDLRAAGLLDPSVPVP
jgi:D-threo-aldose 1-dehydrogenase